ncbi:hypothetical protein KSP35_09700 [Aquihabitans sp. G128]|uniref:hypothetical protein n=1 Tax=Aquihabitans sp. G128 TaxID=2849779 RepID=UPI001C238DC4|nr:hypothetical protein [Aquihabitans sp. G128]QXC63025.1 hypothetical protein KSP35_09700 [Aquihabitans sp. G128]
MGWNLSLVHAQGPSATVEGFALANGYRPQTDAAPASVEEVVLGPDDGDWARPTLAVTETGAGLLLVARLIVSNGWATGLSERKGQATWATWQGSSSTYAFAHYEDGQAVRELSRSEHEVVHESGAPLPAEAYLRWNDPERPADDEQDLFELVRAVTGLPEPATWLEATARRYAPAAITELELTKKKRRFLGR